jgi:hypothetical protein
VPAASIAAASARRSTRRTSGCASSAKGAGPSGHENRRAAVAEDERQPRRREARVEHEVGDAGLHDGQQAGRRAPSERPSTATTFAAAHAERLQVRGEAIGARVELAVGSGSRRPATSAGRCGLVRAQA